MQKLELLSPAGNLEKMKTALAFGADAVYTGIPEFSLRTRVNDFDLAKIKQAAKYCHARKKKIYVTLNVIAHNYHFKNLKKYLLDLEKIKIDALIISDPGVISFTKKVWPKANIHLSTQANCINWASAQFWFSRSVKRVVLGREASIKDIIEIHKKVPKLELECFVHGAMCMAYSGRCFLSKYFVDKSANLGDCVQPCRWEYTTIKNDELRITNSKTLLKAKGHDDKTLELVEEEHGSYILNSKDLCLIQKMDELIKSGVVSFKIEGRAKSVYYVANIIGAYRSAIDLCIDKKIDVKKELEIKLLNRGYTEGFIFGNGQMAQDLERSHVKCNWEFCGTITHNTKHITHNINFIPVKVHNSLKVGDTLEIVKPAYDTIKFKLAKIIDAKTGEELQEAHGGQDKIVLIQVMDNNIPEYSVVRRKIK